MNYIFQLTGAIFPISLSFSFITIFLGIMGLPLALIGRAFFGISLLFIPIALISILAGVMNIAAYFFKRKTIFSKCIFENIDKNEWKHSIGFGEPFVSQCFVELEPVAIEGNQSLGCFILKEGPVTDLANYQNVFKDKREKLEDELEKCSRKDTIWGDLKFFFKMAAREALFRINKTRNELKKDHVNIITQGDFSNVKIGQKQKIYLQSTEEGNSFNFFLSRGRLEINKDDFAPHPQSSLDQLYSYLVSRGKRISILATIIIVGCCLAVYYYPELINLISQ